MTVETTTRKQIFAGGQGTLTFSFRTLVDYPEYIKVLLTHVTSGSTTELTYGVHYTVTINTNGIGGTVIVSPTYSTSYTQTVYRDTSDVQASDYTDYSQFPADTLEQDIDRRTLISQERSEDTDRTAKLPISSSIDSVVLPTPVDGYILGWSGTGGTIINYSTSGFTGSTGAAGPSGAAPTVTRSTFTNSVLSSGILTITHSLGFSTTQSTIIIHFADNNGREVRPDVTYGANSMTADFSNFGTLTGTWNYAYWRN